jgi:hypothetical protein
MPSIYYHPAVNMPSPCRRHHAMNLPWPWEVAYRNAHSWHGRGTAGKRHGNGMACVNQTRPHYVNQMGKTQSNDLSERHGKRTAGEQQGNGMGTAWERHGNSIGTHCMCESAFMRCSEREVAMLCHLVRTFPKMSSIQIFIGHWIAYRKQENTHDLETLGKECLISSFFLYTTLLV